MVISEVTILIEGTKVIRVTKNNSFEDLKDNGLRG